MKKRIDQSVNSLTKTADLNDPRTAISSVKTEKLKSALIRRLSTEYANVGPRLVYQAVNEADALASLTFVPLLVLPALAEEKVQKAAAWSAHQRAVLGADAVAFAA